MLYEFNNFDLDAIIDKSFKALSLDDRMDMFIDDFIENLKA